MLQAPAAEKAQSSVRTLRQGADWSGGANRKVSENRSARRRSERAEPRKRFVHVDVGARARQVRVREHARSCACLLLYLAHEPLCGAYYAHADRGRDEVLNNFAERASLHGDIAPAGPLSLSRCGARSRPESQHSTILS
eukprot:899108-Pleurochrysis_carterae.AAC.1